MFIPLAGQTTGKFARLFYIDKTGQGGDPR